MMGHFLQLLGNKRMKRGSCFKKDIDNDKTYILLLRKAFV